MQSSNRRKSQSARRKPWPEFLLVLMLASGSALAQVLPPPNLPTTPGGLAGAERLFVREYSFEGNTVFPATELARVTEPFANREVTSEEIEGARRAVTVYYVNHGYVNSGAVIPDQNPTNGVVLIRIIEGKLSTIELHGNKWLRDSYIDSRVTRWSRPPLNLNEMKEGLQLLRENPNVRQVNAELKPGAAPGESVLDLRVVDQQPFRVGFQADNQRPPSVGSEEIWLLASDLNLTGHGDILDLRYGIANSTSDGMEFSGADNLAGSYTLPLNRYDTTVSFMASKLNTGIFEESLLPLDIKSETIGYGATLRQPVFQTADQEAAVGLTFDYHRNITWLLGEHFDVSPGAIDGRMSVSALRLTQEWLQREQSYVLALRSSFNIGVDLFDASDSPLPGAPNGQFFSWLGQGQYIQRLFNTQNELHLRLAGQWTAEPLLALEQLPVGGAATVRGYRENQLVRDRGFITSLEFRIPVLFNKTGAGTLFLAPFFDAGGGWNVHQASAEPTTIYSTGLGLVLQPNRHIHAQLFWGYRLRHVPTPADKDPQDLGLHFVVNVNVL
jgi:hemolysin activation/secretion protein